MSYIKRWMAHLAMLGLIVGGPAVFMGCEDQSGPKEVGEDIGESLDDAGDEVEDAVD